MLKTKITPLYERLSRDDELNGDSFSIQNQKFMLEDYARRNGFPNPTHFTDDGISGTRFDRPGFTAMMEQVEAGNVEAIIVKDMLIHDFSDNSLRKVKTDKADSMKIANYALSFWAELRDYSPEDETQQMLKMQNRLYLRTKKSSVVLRNGLISLLDQTFPGINTLFDSQPKRSNGHFKWVASPRPFAPPPARRHTMD